MKVFDFKKLCWATVLLLIPSLALAQAEIRNVKPSGVPSFSYNLVNLAADDPSLSKLNVYLHIPYDELQFVKEKDQYKAQYEISVIVLDKDGEQVKGKDRREEVVAKSYEETNSREIFAMSYISLDLIPNTYDLLLAITDLDSKKTSQQKVQIRLKDFGEKVLSLGEVTYLQRPEPDSLHVEGISPNVMASIDEADSIFYAYFEIYSRIEGDSLRLSYDIKDAKDKTVRSDSWIQKKEGFKTAQYLAIESRELEPGHYLLKLRAQENGFEDSIARSFTIHLVGMPHFITNLEMAIAQLRYIAKGSELKKLRKAPPKDKKKQFLEFWEKKDPTPGTAANELMDEYYRRVDYANQHFRSSLRRNGWETDMGMVYIIFGSPNDVARNPYNVWINPFGGKEIWAYEIWDYYSLNYRFIFVDYTGFGDYTLVTPLPPRPY